MRPSRPLPTDKPGEYEARVRTVATLRGETVPVEVDIPDGTLLERVRAGTATPAEDAEYVRRSSRRIVAYQGERTGRDA